MIDNKILNKIKPGTKIRVHSAGGGTASGEGTSIFEGLVISRKHGKEAGATFVVRSVIADVGVEKIFPVYSPNITKVEILSSPKKLHRAKLYFVRQMPARKIRQKIGVSV